MIPYPTPDTVPPTTLYLIRHGVTAANKENRFAGRTAEPLHPDGIEQIRDVGKQLQEYGISRIIAGPLVRTRQTAAIVSEVISAPITFADDITEILIPHWDGLTKDAIRAEFGQEYPTWLDTPADFFVPGCETLSDVQERAVKCVERIFSEHAGENILVVSHLVVLRCLILYYREMLINDYRTIKIANGEVIRLVRTAGGGTSVCL